MFLGDIVKFEFHIEPLKKLWLDYELATGIEDVIIAVKQAKTKLDFVRILGVIGDAFKKTEGFWLAFLTQEETRRDIAKRLDEVFGLGLLLEPFDEKGWKTLLDWLAQPIEVEVVEG